MIKNQITQQTFDDIIIIMVKDNLESLFETDFKDSGSSLTVWLDFLLFKHGGTVAAASRNSMVISYSI